MLREHGPYIYLYILSLFQLMPHSQRFASRRRRLTPIPGMIDKMIALPRASTHSRRNVGYLMIPGLVLHKLVPRTTRARWKWMEFAHVNTHITYGHISFPCYRAVPANDVIVSNENSNPQRSFSLYRLPSRNAPSLNLGNRFNPSLLGMHPAKLRTHCPSAVTSFYASRVQCFPPFPSTCFYLFFWWSFDSPDRIGLVILVTTFAHLFCISPVSNDLHFNTDRIKWQVCETEKIRQILRYN